ncbi:AAA family ATPase [Sphingomonas sp. 3-13AW]|uniref:AAA family ATPase n=1 Tax=Sphingomonas sp. 3-13AW TaxID=3050450 RepID=UPI003BB61A70
MFSPSQTLDFSRADIDNAVSLAASTIAQRPTIAQLTAAQAILSDSLVFLRGDLGSGVRLILQLAFGAWKILTASIEDPRADVLVLGPTGKAARRLSEVFETEAKTVHAALEYDARTRAWGRLRSNPLHHGLVIIDTLHMLPDDALYALIKACPAAHKAIGHDPTCLAAPAGLPNLGTTIHLDERIRIPANCLPPVAAEIGLPF